MLHKKSLMVAVFTFLLSIFGNAFALDGEYKTPTHEDNAKLLAAGIEHTEAALAAVAAGDNDAAVTHTKEASAALGEINSEAWGGTLEGAKAKVRVGGIKIKKGDVAGGTDMINAALAALKKL